MGRATVDVPRYRHIAEVLAAELASSTGRGNGASSKAAVTLAADGLRLPSEAELIARFGVSRITVRQALAILEQQGLINRAQGRRTYATPAKLVRHLQPLVTFEEDMRRQKVDLVTEVVDFRKAALSAWARERLTGAARRRARRLVLRRLVGGMCVCYDERYLAPSVAGALTPANVTERSTREILSEAGLLLTHLTHETEVIPADVLVAQAMGFPPGTLVMENTYISYAAGTPVEVGRASYRADRFRFSFGERQWKA